MTHIQLAAAQVIQPTFGFVKELRSVRNPIGILSGDFNGDKIPDLAAYSHNQIFLHLQKKDTIDWQTIPLRIERNFISIASERCNNDSRWDIIALEESPSQLEVYLSDVSERFVLAWSAPVQRNYDRMTTGDVNSDGNVDILLYGKKILGIAVFLGNGKGGFKETSKLFTESTFSSVKIVDMNNDGMSDIVATQWVDNQIMMFFSYGKMRYRQPVVLQFDEEPSVCSVARLGAAYTNDLFIAFEHNNVIQAFRDEGFGNFIQYRELQLPASASKIFVDKLSPTTDSSLIALMPNNSQLFLCQYDSIVGFKKGITFSAGNFPLDGCLFSHQRSKLKNLAILNPNENRIRIYYNSNVTPPHEDILMYVSGYKPNDVVVLAKGHYRQFDVAVSHSHSNYLSLFQRTDDNVLRGPVPTQATTLTGNLTYFFKNDSTILLVGENVLENRIAAIEIDTRTMDAVTTSFPSRTPQILASRLTQSDGYLRVLVLEQDPSSLERSIVLFEQITDRRFAERQLNEVPSKNLLAATAKFSSNAFYIWYAAGNERKKRTEVFRVIYNDKNEGTKPQHIFDVPLHPVQHGFLWERDLNNDRLTDFIFLAGEPFDTLLSYVADKNGKYISSLIPQTSRVNVLSRERVKFFDFNNDRNIDLVLDNSMTKTIQVYLGKGNGAFLEPFRLISSEGFGGFTLSDINDDNAPDVIVTDAAQGYVKVIPLKEIE